MRTTTTIVILASLLGGCGGASVWSCNVPSTRECQEFPALVTAGKISGVGDKCARVSMGTWQNAPCSRAQLVGGCAGRLDAGDPESEATTWFYVGSPGVSSAADVQATCAASGTTYVAP